MYSLLSEADRVRICYQLLLQIKFDKQIETKNSLDAKTYPRMDPQEGLLDFLKRHQIYQELTPLHSRSRMIQKMLNFKINGSSKDYNPDETLTSAAMKRWFMPVPLIREYYGEEIAIYFEWMNFFLRWISIPGACGLAIFILNQLVFDPSTSPLSGLFAIMMAFWGALFSLNWQKHQAGLRIQWDNLFQSERHLEQIREDFVGTTNKLTTLKLNPVTETNEPYYSSQDRLIRYLESILIITPCFAVVFAMLICCNNLNGIITVEKHGDSFLVIPMLADLAAPGAIFDADSNMNYAITVFQVVLTLIFNINFRKVATWTTDRENHKY